jgi:acetyl-CoA synthetase
MMTEMTEKSLESILTEERVFAPPASFMARARIKPADYERLVQEAARDSEGYWARLAREELAWSKPFTQVLDSSKAPNYRWFADGELNASANCLDVHLAARGDKTAIIFESEPGEVRTLTYRQLTAEVSRLANALKALGVSPGDRVVVYMPMVPEAVIAMQACARIGAVHSVVFGGFSARSLKDRIEDAGARLVITADGGRRGGKLVDLKSATDEALAEGCPTIGKVLVLKHAGNPVAMRPGRDLWWSEAVASQPDACPPLAVNAEHPLFLLYTSGSTGKPKGIQHATGGYLLNAKLTNQWIFDLQDSDVFWCTADVGWVTGHTYVAYGPLAAGATIVMYEGAPAHPDPGRFWSICERHGVTVFYTAPTAIRALMKHGDVIPAQYDLSRIRLLGTVGEPINPEAWIWYHRTIGKKRCPIVDTWWQTETGGILVTPIPGAVPTKPGSATRPFPGIFPEVVDERGTPVGVDQGGYLILTKPWPGMLRGIWGDPKRFEEQYFSKYPGIYFTGDGARRDKDGYFWVMGRVDDVMNVAGHRLSTMEIESALVSHDAVAEAAVVGRPDDIKGTAIAAFVSLERGNQASEELRTALKAHVAREIGALARPDDLRFTDSLPKTRSGKIMRRLLRDIAAGRAPVGDTTTLEDYSVLARLREDEEV